jgi:hypothetical protein
MAGLSADLDYRRNQTDISMHFDECFCIGKIGMAGQSIDTDMKGLRRIADSSMGTEPVRVPLAVTIGTVAKDFFRRA